MGGTDLGARDDRPCLTLPGAIRRGDVPALCDRASGLLEQPLDRVLDCDVATVGDEPDLTTVEALARVELTAKRLGAGVRLLGASVELLELLALCGLPFESVVEAEREAEEREEPGGVEEEGDARDPVA